MKVLQSSVTVPVYHSRLNFPEPGAVSVQKVCGAFECGSRASCVPGAVVGWPKSWSINAGRSTPWGCGGSCPCAGSGLKGQVMPHCPLCRRRREDGENGEDGEEGEEGEEGNGGNEEKSRTVIEHERA